MSSLLSDVRALTDAMTWEGFVWFMIRLSVILAVGHLAIVVLAGRVSAATRHLVSVGTLGAALAVPVAIVAIPAREPIVIPGSVASAMPILEQVPTKVPMMMPTMTPSMAATVESTPSASLEAWFVVLFWLSVAVTIGFIARIVSDATATRGLFRDATEIRNGRISVDLERARNSLSIRRPVPVLVSRRIAIPLVVGILRPTLFLPPNVLTWSSTRRQAVLLHELAHVRRYDGLTLLLGRIATALLWFHPLAWMLARIARRECERACDDVVLSAGVRASDYARYLVAIARHASPSEGVPGFTPAFARQGSLENRLQALLCTGVPRNAASRLTVAIIGCLTLAVLLPVASLRAVALPAHDLSFERAESADTNYKYLHVAREVSQKDHSTLLPDKDVYGKVRDLAVETYVDLKESHSENPMAWRSIGHALLWYGEPMLAADAFERQYKINHCASALYNMGCALSVAGERERALHALERAETAGMLVRKLARQDPDLTRIRSEIMARQAGAAAPPSTRRAANGIAPVALLFNGG